MSTIVNDIEKHAADSNHIEAANITKPDIIADDETSRYVDSQPIIIDAATNKRLFWKINRRVLVIMLVTYFCQSLDKGTLGFSSIMGIQTDAHLVGQEVDFFII